MPITQEVLKIGDILGVDSNLPDDLQHLTGWMVYHINNKGIPHLLEPASSAPKNTVSLKTVSQHAKKLYDEGHVNEKDQSAVHLWGRKEFNRVAITVKDHGLEDKAQLNAEKDTAGYWALHRRKGMIDCPVTGLIVAHFNKDLYIARPEKLMHPEGEKLNLRFIQKSKRLGDHIQRPPSMP